MYLNRRDADVMAADSLALLLLLNPKAGGFELYSTDCFRPLSLLSPLNFNPGCL